MEGHKSLAVNCDRNLHLWHALPCQAGWHMHFPVWRLQVPRFEHSAVLIPNVVNSVPIFSFLFVNSINPMGQSPVSKMRFSEPAAYPAPPPPYLPPNFNLQFHSLSEQSAAVHPSQHRHCVLSHSPCPLHGNSLDILGQIALTEGTHEMLIPTKIRGMRWNKRLFLMVSISWEQKLEISAACGLSDTETGRHKQQRRHKPNVMASGFQTQTYRPFPSIIKFHNKVWGGSICYIKFFEMAVRILHFVKHKINMRYSIFMKNIS